MIRKLTEADRSQALSLLEQAPAFNLYMLGNIAANGFATDFCEFWGDVAEDGHLRAVLNRYLRGWVIYGEAESDWPGLAEILDTHPLPPDRFQDNPGGVPSFLPYLQRYQASRVEEQTLMELTTQSFKPASAAPQARIRRATLDDFDALVEFYADAAEMSRSPTAVDRPLRDRRIWLAEQDTSILATALTNAETAGAAMIGGVYTKPVYRGQGLSQAVTGALCAELLAEGKKPVLYWGNPAAGRVYQRLGFQQIGVWRSVWLASKDNE